MGKQLLAAFALAAACQAHALELPRTGLSISTAVATSGATATIAVHFEGLPWPTVAVLGDLALPQGLEVLDCAIDPATGKDLYALLSESDGKRRMRFIVVALDHRLDLHLAPGPLFTCDVRVIGVPGFYPLLCEYAEVAEGCPLGTTGDCSARHTPECAAGGVLIPPAVECPADVNLDQRVTVDELVSAVNAARDGCR